MFLEQNRTDRYTRISNEQKTTFATEYTTTKAASAGERADTMSQDENNNGRNMMDAVQDLLSGTAEYAEQEATAALKAGTKTAESALNAASDVAGSAVDASAETASSALKAGNEAINSAAQAGMETADSLWQTSIDTVQSAADAVHEKAKGAAAELNDDQKELGKEQHTVPQDIMESFPTVE